VAGLRLRRRGRTGPSSDAGRDPHTGNFGWWEARLIRFLIDENLSPRLVETAASFGYAAFHVAHRGWSSLPDPQVLRHVLDEDLTLVTNNWIDFEPMLKRLELHPGAIVILPNVRRERQMELFAITLAALDEHDPPVDMINTVLQVDADGTVIMYPLPQP
jgi:predicted nuclease of predicted toxin-antitoxin system